MRRQQLRPLSVGETLDATFKIYTSNFVKLITIVAVVLVPVLLLQSILNLTVIDGLSDVDPDDVTSIGDFFSPGQVIASFVLALLGWAANALASGAVVKAVADNYVGSESDWQESVRFAFTKLAPLMIGSLLFGLGVAFGSILLIVPGIILAVSWAVFASAIVVEGQSATGGLGRSWNLMSGRRWPVFGTFLLLFIAIIIVNFIIGLILGGLFAFGGDVDGVTVGGEFLNIIVSILTTPILAIATVVIYFDLRVRKEGFDVELLASQIGEPVPDGYSPPPQSDMSPPPEATDDPGSAWPPAGDS